MSDQGRLQADDDRLRDLLVRGMAGDAAAYHAFLEALSTRLRAFLRKRLSGFPDEVEDVVQEALLAVHNHRQTYDPGQPLSAWVHAIAKYKLVDFLRRRMGRDARLDPLDDHIDVLATEDGEATHATRDLAKLLERLPDKQRHAIVCMKLQGLSVIETARVTGMSESAVKVSVHRGLKALAAIVKDER